MQKWKHNLLRAAVICGAMFGGSAMSHAANWVPAVDNTWQWQLSGDLNTGYDVDVYDIDLFDTPVATINDLHAQGRKVICYFSAGSSEEWRDDFADFTEADQGNPLDGWDGERWLDTRSENVRAIMIHRLDLAAEKGCDGVEPDNIDGYQPDNNAGLPLTAAIQVDYLRFLATAAHERGLAIGLKNDVDNVPALVNAFDFAVNEECHEYEECDVYVVFINAGKPVFNAEYEPRFHQNTDGARDQLCAASRAMNMRTLVLPLDLDDTQRYACDDHDN